MHTTSIKNVRHAENQETMSIGGRSYPVIGYIKADGVKETVPLVDIPLMSDERWEMLSRKNAVENYIKELGRKPESVDAAVKWQREWVARMLEEEVA